MTGENMHEESSAEATELAEGIRTVIGEAARHFNETVVEGVCDGAAKRAKVTFDKKKAKVAEEGHTDLFNRLFLEQLKKDLRPHFAELTSQPLFSKRECARYAIQGVVTFGIIATGVAIATAITRRTGAVKVADGVLFTTQETDHAAGARPARRGPALAG